MKVNNVTKWIVINQQAASLLNVIAAGVFKDTTVGKDRWLSLIDGGELQMGCNKEGFNLKSFGNIYNPDGYVKVQIGIIASNQNYCNACDSFIGFGTSVVGCLYDKIKVRNTICGNTFVCLQWV